jgi:hypothetical protein
MRRFRMFNPHDRLGPLKKTFLLQAKVPNQRVFLFTRHSAAQTWTSRGAADPHQSTREEAKLNLWIPVLASLVRNGALGPLRHNLRRELKNTLSAMKA